MFESAPFTWFTENPLPILTGGGVVLLVLLVLLLKTGRGAILTAMLGVAILMGLAVLIDRLVVTDRERVANLVYEAAAAAQRNEIEPIIANILPSATAVRAEARRWIGQARLSDVTITNMRVDLDRGAKPPVATAVFRVIAKGEIRDRTAVYPGDYFGLITAHFVRSEDRWMLADYEHEP
jgi:hypothetical protein